MQDFLGLLRVAWHIRPSDWIALYEVQEMLMPWLHPAFLLRPPPSPGPPAGMTENYGASRDPPEKQAPMCTVHSFPHNIDHCLTWAR